MTSHVIIGTSKEIVQVKIERRFDLNNISLGVFDDIDIVTTTTLMKNNILEPFLGRKVFSTIKSAMKHIPPGNNQDIIINDDQMVITEAFIKCHHGEKIFALITTYYAVAKFGGQILVFCRVCFLQQSNIKYYLK